MNLKSLSNGVVIAEIGINHNGDLGMARHLIDVAVGAGCAAVKFQKRTLEVVYSREELAKSRPVDRSVLESALARGVLDQEAMDRLRASNFEASTNGDLKRALEFTQEEYEQIDAYCRERGIAWTASCWDEGSVDFLAQFDPPFWKIASASLTDSDLLRHTRCAAGEAPIILSTGMSTMEEIKTAVDVLGRDNLILMHTVMVYPADDSQLNLRMIQTLQREFPGIPVGYSGHETGVATSVMAVVLGACCVERHITLNRAMWGSDQSASLESHGLELLVRDIRKVPVALGDGIKRVLPEEEAVKAKLRRK